MIEIKDLLSRFEGLLLSSNLKRDTLITVIKEVCGFDLKKEDIEIKGVDVFLNIKPIYKNEVFIHQEEIISKLNESFDKDKVKITKLF